MLQTPEEALRTEQSIESSRPTHHLLAIFGWLVRATLPVAILSIGIFAFARLSIELPEETKEPEEKKVLRTNVAQLHRQDYEVVVETHGVVQPHNQIGVSPQVTGRIQRISPNFEVGAYVEAGEVLVELEKLDFQIALEIAQARLDGALAAEQLTQQDHQRNQELMRSRNVSEAELNLSAATMAQAAATVEQARAELEGAQRNLDRTRIIAPFRGRVRSRSVGIGELVSSGAILGEIFATDYAEVRLPISGRQREFLNLPEHNGDASVKVELRDGVNLQSDRVWRAEIVRTEGFLDQNSLELFAIARIDDPFGLESGDPPLRMGQPVRASIGGTVLTDVIAVPRLAVRQLDQVYLVDRDSLTLTLHTIDPVWSDEEFVIVRDGALDEPGKLLSTTQLVYAPTGSKVEIIPDVDLVAAESSANSSAETPENITN